MPVKLKHMFGTEQRLELGEKITVSDPEKTALDCLEYGIGTFAFPELTAIVARVLRHGEWERLMEYLRRFDSGPLARRLATLMTLAKISPPESVWEVLGSFPVPLTPIRLDPTRPVTHTDSLDRRWGVRINVPTSDLFCI
jgi:predicted transcriptional regulator of viral defense system